MVWDVPIEETLLVDKKILFFEQLEISQDVE